MTLLQMVTRAALALIITAAFGYFLWVEIPQFLFFQSTPGRVEYIEPVCFLSSEGQETAADCASVRARAGKKRVYQMYRTTIRYQSPADDREHLETIVTRAVGPARVGATWQMMAHTSDARRVQPVNMGGRSILFGVTVLLFVFWLRAALNRFVRRKIQSRFGRGGASGPLSPQQWVLGGVAFVVFMVILRVIRP